MYREYTNHTKHRVGSIKSLLAFAFSHLLEELAVLGNGHGAGGALGSLATLGGRGRLCNGLLAGS